MITKIYIDRGHGGKAGEPGYRPGNINNGVVEEEWTLQCAQDLVAACSDIRDLDMYLPQLTAGPAPNQAQRGAMSAKFAADFVLQIHANAGTPQDRGADVWHWEGNATGREIAEAIAKAMPQPVWSGRTWICDEARWPRVRHCMKPHVATTVFVEAGFLTHEPDARFLASDLGRAQIVTALRTGVLKAIELKIKQTKI